MHHSRTCRPISYGWWIVTAYSIFYIYLGGTYFYGFTAIFNPIVDEFGWSYALVSLAFTLRGFEAGILAPIVGFFADRLSSRKLMAIGVIVFGAGFLVFSIIQDLWSFYAASLILALGSSLTSPVVTMTTVTRWFRSKMTLAMGLLTAGLAAGGFLTPAVIWAIDQFSWREVVFVFGAITWILGIPLLLIIKEPQINDPSKKARKSLETKAETELEGLNAKDALRTRNFWLLSLAVFFSGIASTAIIVHLIPYIVSIGISRQTAGFLAMGFAAANIAGRLLFGWLGDLFNKKHCFVIATVVLAAGIFVFATAREVWHCVTSLTAIGLGFGGLIPLRPALQVKLFGSKSFGTLQGILMTAITVGAVIAPLFAGWMFDLQQSYRFTFIILGVITLIALPLTFALPRMLQETS